MRSGRARLMHSIPDPVALAVIAVEFFAGLDLTGRDVEPAAAEERGRVAVGSQEHIPPRRVKVMIDIARFDVEVLSWADHPSGGGRKVLCIPAAHLLPAA